MVILEVGDFMKLKNFLLLILICLFFTSCYSEKDNPLYNSEWISTNIDANNQTYYHQLFLKPDHTVTLQATYENSTNVIVWTGTYKLTSKKIIFNFTKCTRFENLEPVGNYTTGKLIKYYTGDFYYSVALIEESPEVKRYHMQLTRPEKYFYGKSTDIFGNQLEEFIKR